LGRTSEELKTVRQLQVQARTLTAEWRSPGFDFDVTYMSASEAEGIATAALAFLEGFRKCRPDSLDLMRERLRQAREASALLPMSHVPFSDDREAHEAIWRAVAEVAYAQVDAFATLTPYCQS
jgi:putative protein kinase ArgK-like GTPase of G3E family